MLFKNTMKKIRKSLGRYLSLMIIILLGVAFWAGLKQAVPSMQRVQNEYYSKTNLMDLKISSTLGLTDEDVNAIEKLEGIEYAVGSYSKNVLDGENAINLHAIEDRVNNYELIEGRIPEKESECLADAENYKIGDIINITEDNEENNIKMKQFTVVGTIRFPIYTSEEYGNASVGNGKLQSFILIPKENFDYEVYTEIYILANKNELDIPYSNSYEQIIDNITNEINSIKEERQNARYNEVVGEAQEKLDEAKQELEDKKSEAEEEFAKAEKEISDGQAEIEKGQKELNSNRKTAEEELKNAQEEINSQKEILIQNQELLENNKVQAEHGFKEAETKKQELEENKNQVLDLINENQQQINTIDQQLKSTELAEEEIKELEENKMILIATQATLNSNLAQIESGIQEIENTINTTKQELENAEIQIQEGFTKLEEAQKELDNQKIEINKQLNEAQKKINNSKKELEEGKQELEESKKEYEEKISEAQIKIDDAQEEVDKIEEAKWYVLNRNAVVTSYRILKNQYQQVEIIAEVIPLFFIAVVILMTSNTMTRMIAEERGEMGTLSSLGVSNVKIVSNYMIYVLSSTILGGIIGYLIGTFVIPQLIYECFPLLMPEMIYEFDVISFATILFVAGAIMSSVTIFSCKKELKEKPAYLLRPVPPKKGKKILLERIGFIWNNLSFSWKITMRNISRYKKRVIMTLIGTAGCTFLILIGFAIKDSINGIGDRQYTEIFRYDNLIILDSSIENMTESLSKTLEGNVKNPVLLNQSSYKAKDGEGNSIDTYIIVAEPSDEFYKYFNLRDLDTGENITLSDDGIIITHKINKRTDKGIGDNIILEDIDKKQFKAKVIGIADNTFLNYVYMTPTQYEQIFGEKIKYNTIVSENDGVKEEIANNLLASGKILSVNFSDDLLKQANTAIEGLNNIVILLVVISSMLAITVLYNLTSINISERTREIATLKVLGFKELETNQYIYRETLITVIIGIAIGLLITPAIHTYIIELLDSDEIAMIKQIKFISFVISAGMTMIFAIIMQIVTFFKLKKINMIESLKSVE